MHWKRILLSFLICLQLLVVAVGPNRDTYLVRIFNPWIDRYMETLELGSAWNFFSPDPGPPPLFLEWEVLSEKGDLLASETYPGPSDSFFLRERQNRRIALTRFLFNQDDRYVAIIGPYQCRLHPDARSVRLWKMNYATPNLFEIRSGKRAIGDDVGSTRKAVGSFICARNGQST